MLRLRAPGRAGGLPPVRDRERPSCSCAGRRPGRVSRRLSEIIESAVARAMSGLLASNWYPPSQYAHVLGARSGCCSGSDVGWPDAHRRSPTRGPARLRLKLCSSGEAMRRVRLRGWSSGAVRGRPTSRSSEPGRLRRAPPEAAHSQACRLQASPPPLAVPASLLRSATGRAVCTSPALRVLGGLAMPFSLCDHENWASIASPSCCRRTHGMRTTFATSTETASGTRGTRTAGSRAWTCRVPFSMPAYRRTTGTTTAASSTGWH